MTAFIIPKDFSKKLAKLLKTVDEDDREEAIAEFVAKLKPVKAARKTKAKKDPNAPKRGSSGYIFYGKKRRPEIKEEDPDMAFGDITKMIAAEWKELSDKEKKPYLAQAAKDKIRYEKEKKEYESGSGSDNETEKKPKARKSKVESDEDSEEKEEVEKPKAKGRKAPAKAETDNEEDEPNGEDEAKAEPMDEESDADETPEYEKMTVAQLRELCKKRKIDAAKLTKKADLIEALE